MVIRNKLGMLFLIIVFSHNSSVALQPQSSAIQQLKVSNTQNALIAVRKIIDNYPADIASAQVYEKKESNLLFRCAYVVYNNARVQILEALREIDNRKAYWQYQKDHQWQYFFTKNPLKWVTGEAQGAEIQNNLELLESHQGEMYVLLGQLLEHGAIFTQGYKTSFVADPQKGYEWLDGLFDVLSRVKVANYNSYHRESFRGRAVQLKLTLEGVRYFKEDLLADIKETQIPSKIAQNWFKYGVLGAGLAVGYQLDGLEKLKYSLGYIGQQTQQQVVSPVQKVLEDVFVPHKTGDDLLVDQEEIEVAKKSIKDFINSLKIKDDSWIGYGDVYRKDVEGIVNETTGDIDMAKLHVLSDKFSGYSGIKNNIVATKLWGILLGLQAGNRSQKQYEGIGKIAFLTPAAFSGLLAYTGYQKLTEKNYSSIRRALLKINSLFVDQSKPLDDQRYGEMAYLLYSLRKLAERDLLDKKNVRTEFLSDLENIESKEFDIAAKRRIVDDMFRKYSFLEQGYKK